MHIRVNCLRVVLLRSFLTQSVNDTQFQCEKAISKLKEQKLLVLLRYHVAVFNNYRQTLCSSISR